MKWVWVTPIWYDQKESKWIEQGTEILINLDTVKYISKDQKGEVYSVWFIGEGHQETITLSRAGFNSIPCMV